MTDYTPATREDLKPGAVFIVRDPGDIWEGQRVFCSEDDGTDIPWFSLCDKPDGARRLYDMVELEVSPSAASTITIPRDVAAAWIDSMDDDETIGARAPRVALLDALRAALVATDPKITEAIKLLEAKGFTVAPKAR